MAAVAIVARVVNTAAAVVAADTAAVVVAAASVDQPVIDAQIQLTDRGGVLKSERRSDSFVL